nr:hypothetical protein [Tanacetum cinerariifolium]
RRPGKLHLDRRRRAAGVYGRQGAARRGGARLNSYLGAFDEVATRTGGKGAKEYSDAKDRAEHAAEEAAGRVELLEALNAIAAAAAGVGPLLANQGVTDAHRQTLDDAIALYTSLVDVP